MFDFAASLVQLIAYIGYSDSDTRSLVNDPLTTASALGLYDEVLKGNKVSRIMSLIY
jgi:hypothetical protein